MARVFQIMVLGYLSFCLIGCNGTAKSKPIWEQVKIGDIAPSDSSKQLTLQLLKTINFNVHIFETPAENISKLDDVWKVLRTQPLRFKDYRAFRANLFLVRFGQIPMRNKIIDLLGAAESHKVVTVSLLLLDGQAEAITVAGLDSERTISYISTGGSTKAVTIGPGVLALQIKATKIPGLRGVCNVIAQPVFLPPISSPIPELVARAREREFLFSSAAFGLKMSPGDLVLVGPGKYTSDQKTLCGLFFGKPEGSLFFSKTKRKGPELKPAVRIFLLVCTGISD